MMESVRRQRFGNTRPGGRKKFRVSQAIMILLICILAVMSLYPIVLMLFKSVKTPEQEIYNPLGLSFPFAFTNYRVAWEYVSDCIWNTFVISALQTLGLVAVCGVGAYGFTRFEFRGKGVLTILILALMMIPGVLTLVSQYALADTLGLVNTRAGVILPNIAASIPFGWLLLKTFFSGLPKDLFDAAEIDGASHVRRFLSVAIPLSMPILATLGLMTFLGAWNDLLWPKLILVDDELQTISLRLVPFTDNYYKQTYSMSVPIAGYVICSLPLIVLFLFTSKQFIAGLSSGAFKM